MERGHRTLEPGEPGQLLRALRRDRGISQRHLAELSGVDQAVISRLERGAEARWGTWKRLFLGLGYVIGLTTTPYAEDDVEDFIEYGIQTRKDRMQAGRESRW